MSSGNDSDESSDVDSPGPPSLKATQTLLTDSPPVMEAPQGSQGLNLNKPQCQGQQPSTSTSATATNNESIYYDVFKPSASSSSASQNQQPSNIVYPASALANIPQEVLLGLIQSGHLQLHTEEDGSGHQYITIPLSMAAAAAASANNNGAGSTQATDLASRPNASATSSSASAIAGTAATTSTSSTVSHRDSIRVKKEFND